MMSGVLAAAGWVWLSLAACSQAAPAGQAAAAPQAAAGQSEVVATVDGTPITAAEVDEPIAANLAKLNEQLYDLRKDQLDAMIAERLVSAEARRRGVSEADLLTQEVNDKIPPVTEAEIAAFVEQNRARIQGDPAALTPRIRAFLENQRIQSRRDEFLESLRAKAAVTVTLKAPPVFRAPIDLAGAPAKGPASAKVTIVEFSDFHCPFCKRVQPTLQQVLAKYPDDVRLVYKHMPLDSLHPQARRAAEASWCAQQQGKFWEYHDLVYAGGSDASPATLNGYAEKAGLNVATFTQCLAGDQAKAVVQAHVSEGAKYGVSGTPGFFVNGRFLSGAQPLDAFVKMIDEEIQGTR